MCHTSACCRYELSIQSLWSSAQKCGLKCIFDENYSILVSHFAPSKKASVAVTECKYDIREACYLQLWCLTLRVEMRHQQRGCSHLGWCHRYSMRWVGDVSDRMLIAICGAEQINSTVHVIGVGHIRTSTPFLYANARYHLTAGKREEEEQKMVFSYKC